MEAAVAKVMPIPIALFEFVLGTIYHIGIGSSDRAERKARWFRALVGGHSGIDLEPDVGGVKSNREAAHVLAD